MKGALDLWITKRVLKRRTLEESNIPQPASTYPLPPTRLPTNLILDTDHEVTIRVGQESLQLRNMDGKLRMRVQGMGGGSRSGD